MSECAAIMTELTSWTVGLALVAGLAILVLFWEGFK
nr:MAG TPA: hypothetical protein [Caudoviricetes sp.]